MLSGYKGYFRLRFNMFKRISLILKFKKASFSTQKRVDSSGILIRFNGVSISNMTKIPLESTLFLSQNGTLVMGTNLKGNVHI